MYLDAASIFYGVAATGAVIVTLRLIDVRQAYITLLGVLRATRSRLRRDAAKNYQKPALDRRDSDWLFLEYLTKHRSDFRALCQSHPVLELADDCFWQEGLCSQRCSLDKGRPVSHRGDARSPEWAQAHQPVHCGKKNSSAVIAAVPDSMATDFAALLECRASDREGCLWNLACSLFGNLDGGKQSEHLKWESILSKAALGLQYDAWRVPWRKSLYLYCTCLRLPGLPPPLVADFQLDDSMRLEWDSSTAAISFEAACEEGACRGSGMLTYRVKYPRPMSSRLYRYARRVFRPQGACYIISQATKDDSSPAVGGVAVSDFTSCIAVTAVPGGTQVVTLYFEDPHARPSLVNSAVKKGLWRYARKFAAAAVDYCQQHTV